MSTAQPHSQLLDQIQAEVDRILEHTGRLFAAANKGNRSSAAAHASKLKREFPGSLSRFHDALDALEDELQLAKAVMRRDLAVHRTAAGKTMPSQAIVVDEAKPIEMTQSTPDVESTALEHAENTGDSAEVEMHDAKPDATQSCDKAEQQGAADSEKSPEVTLQEAEDRMPAQDASEPAAQEQQDDKPSPERPTDQAPNVDVVKPADSTLHVDTDSKPPDATQDGAQKVDDDDMQPDTAGFSDTRDLDSLFNDPASAGAGEGPDFGPNTTTSFDFDEFTANLQTNMDSNTADNDNINALLPGLQDYANTQPTGSGEPDFSALFATDVPVGGGEGQAEGDGGQQHDGQHRDSTFDDLMDFENFNNAGDYTGNGNDGSGQDFSFAFD